MIVTTTVNNTKYSHHQKKVKGCVRASGHFLQKAETITKFCTRSKNIKSHFYTRSKLLRNFVQDQQGSFANLT